MSKDVFTRISGDRKADRCGDCASDLCFCDCHDEEDYEEPYLDDSDWE